MTPLVAGLLSLLAVCSAAKLGDPAADPAAPVPRLPRRLPAYGDRLSAFRRRQRPVIVPIPPGVKLPDHFGGAPLLRLPPGVAPPENVTVPLLIPFPPGMKGPGANLTAGLIALPPPPPPPSLALPANFSTRVARHQLPLLVRPPGVVYATPPPHLLNQLKRHRQLAAAAKAHQQSLEAGQSSALAAVQSPAGSSPSSASPLTPASTTLIRTSPQSIAAQKPSFLDYFIPKGSKDARPAEEVNNGITNLPRLAREDFLKAIRRRLPAPKQPIGKIRSLLPPSLTPPTNEYLPPSETPSPTPPKDEYLPPPPPTPPKDEYLPPPPPTPPKDEYLPPPPPTPPKDEYLPPPPPTPPKDEYLPPPPPTPPKDEYLPPPPPTPPKGEYLPPPPAPDKTKKKGNAISKEVRNLISLHLIRALNQYLPPQPQPVTPPKDEYLPPPVSPPKEEYLPPPPTTPAQPVTVPKDEYLPPPPPSPPSNEYLPPETTTTTTQRPAVPPLSDEYLPPPPSSVKPPADGYLPPPPSSVEPPADGYLPPPASAENAVIEPESIYQLPSEEPQPSPGPPSSDYLPPPGGRFAARTPSKTAFGSSKRRKFKVTPDGVLRRVPASSAHSPVTESVDSGDPCDSLSCLRHERCQVILACAHGPRSCAATRRIAECLPRSHPTCHHCHRSEVCVLKKHCAYSQSCPGAMQCMSRNLNG